MSAYYAVAYADRIELLTDGAIYTDDGVVVETREKVWRSERLPLAFAGRGNNSSIQLMGLALDAVSIAGKSIEEILEWLSGTLETKRRQGAPAFDGIIASVSKTNGPQLHWFTTYGEFEGFEPFKLYDVGAEWGGGPTPTDETLAAWGFPEKMSNSTLAESGPDLFEAMRQTKMAHLAAPGQPMLHAVGGHVDLTTVTAKGSTTKRLRTWPDKIGEKIKPDQQLAEAA